MSGGGDGSSGEKTELPTPKRLRDARKKGQVARSQEVVTTASLMSVIVYVYLTWGETNTRLIALMDEVAAMAERDFQSTASAALLLTFRDTVMVLLPVVGVTILAGIAANYLQFGSIFAFENLMPKLEKISPAKGVKRIFSMKQLLESLKSVVKIVFLSLLLYFVLRDAIQPYIQALACGLPCLTSVTNWVLLKLLSYSAFAFIIVALIDFAYQRHSHTKSLMMTKEEVKREYKESEGDPHIKSKRKQLAQELIFGDGGGAASKSSAVVINPTHLAVAIAYRPEEVALPMVVAKGRNERAVIIRTSAEEAGVPIFRNIHLARTLFAEVEVDQFIPDELFDVIAEVLVWVKTHRDTLYKGPLSHGVIDMDAGDHRAKNVRN
jgi:type III secretion protein U